MILYYTGAVKSGDPQLDASKSLGGWISNTIVPNSRPGNLFNSVSTFLIQNPQKQLRVIALKNTTGATINNLKIWTTAATTSLCKYKIAIIAPYIDTDCNCPYFETLQSENSLPYYVELQSHEDELSALTLATLPNNNYIGIFIQRDVKDTVPGYKGNPISCDSIVEEDPDDVNVEEDIQLNFKWD